MKKIITAAAIALVSCIHHPQDEQTAYEAYRLENAAYVGESYSAGVYLQHYQQTIVLTALIDGYAAADSCEFVVLFGSIRLVSSGAAAVKGSCRAEFSESALSAACSKNLPAAAEIDGMDGIPMEIMCAEID